MNTIHLTIHHPGGTIDPLDAFWVLFNERLRLIDEEYQYVEKLRARDAWRIAKAFGHAAQQSFDVLPVKRQFYIGLGVNGRYYGGPDGMWEELFDDADVELSYEVKSMPGEVADAA